MLQRIVSQKYRNLDITSGINLYDLNIFIGENGAGKTNLIDLIVFCSNLEILVQNSKTLSSTVFLNQLNHDLIDSKKHFRNYNMFVQNRIAYCFVSTFI